VLPKLREENERALAKKKSNPVKDVLVEGVFYPLEIKKKKKKYKWSELMKFVVGR
jgi:hypothetical protein